jgi:hypothetical protein
MMPNYSGLDDQPCHPRPSPGEEARNPMGDSLEYIPVGIVDADDAVELSLSGEVTPESLKRLFKTRVYVFSHCTGCGQHLGLSMLTSEDGRLEELRIRPLRDDHQEVIPGVLVLDSTGIYCKLCGTHVTKAEEIAERSIA